jgi:hypothetical protein
MEPTGARVLRADSLEITPGLECGRHSDCGARSVVHAVSLGLVSTQGSQLASGRVAQSRFLDVNASCAVEQVGAGF